MKSHILVNYFVW